MHGHAVFGVVVGFVGVGGVGGQGGAEVAVGLGHGDSFGALAWFGAVFGSLKTIARAMGRCRFVLLFRLLLGYTRFLVCSQSCKRLTASLWLSKYCCHARALCCQSARWSSRVCQCWRRWAWVKSAAPLRSHDRVWWACCTAAVGAACWWCVCQKAASLSKWAVSAWG